MNIKRLTTNVEYLKRKQENLDYPCNWMHDEVAHLVYSYVLYYHPDLVIHTGFLWGKSSAVILEALVSIAPALEGQPFGKDIECEDFISKHSRPALEGKLIAVDPNIFNLDIRDSLVYLSNQFDFDFYKMESKDFFSKHSNKISKSYKDKLIMGIVDGDHTEQGCERDLAGLHNLNAKVILVDDTIWLPYLDAVCREFAYKWGYDYINHRLYTGLGVLIKNE